MAGWPRSALHLLSRRDGKLWLETTGLHRSNTRLRTFAQASGEVQRTVGTTSGELRLGRFAGFEHGDRVIPFRPRAGLRIQMHHGTPATGYGQQITTQRLPGTAHRRAIL